MTAREHVLILTDVQPPDNVSTAHIVSALANDLVDAGHRVTVVSTRPHSRPEGPIVDRPAGPRIIRVPVHNKSGSAIGNALIWAFYMVQGWFVGMVRVHRATVVLAVTPPPGIGLVGSWVARRHGARFFYNVKELYPDIAISLGVRWRPLIGAVRWVENRAFRKAETVVTSTPTMRDRIAARSAGTPVIVVPDGVDTAPFAAAADGTAFRQEFGIAWPFVVGYAGNMGAPQNLDMLLDAAAIVAGEGIGVVLVGAGTERDRLAGRVTAEGLDNVTIVPHQPVARVPEIYAACDAVYVSLAAGTGAEAMPSKVYQIMAAGKPLLAAAAADATLATMVDNTGAGIVADLTAQSIAEAMRSLRTADRDAMGDRGRRFVETGYSRRAVAQAFLDLIASRPPLPGDHPDKG